MTLEAHNDGLMLCAVSFKVTPERKSSVAMLTAIRLGMLLVVAAFNDELQAEYSLIVTGALT